MIATVLPLLTAAALAQAMAGPVSRPPILGDAEPPNGSRTPPRLFRGARARRRTSRVVDALPDLVDGLARSMRAGASLRQAIVETSAEIQGPLGEELGELVEAMRQGRSVESAVVAFAERVPGPEARTLAGTLSLAAENESGTAHALDGVASALRDRAGLAAEIRALTSQARASSVATASLPLAFLAFTALFDRAGAAYLVRDPFGRVCLVTGLLLDALGFAWMHRLVGRPA